MDKIIPVIIWIGLFVFIDGLANNGWCTKYSRENDNTQEDITVIESFNNYRNDKRPTCQWKLHFQNATKLKLEYEISSLPFSGKFFYDGFQGWVSKTVYDILEISTDDCRHGYANHSLTVQHTTATLFTDIICFKHITKSSPYDNNKLELRIRVTVEEVLCRDDQVTMETKAGCRIKCMPNNKTREACRKLKPTEESVSTTRLHNPFSVENFSRSPKTNHSLVDVSTKSVDPFHINIIYPPSTANSPKPVQETERSIFTSTVTSPSSSTENGLGTLLITETLSPKTIVTMMTDQDVRTGLYIASTITGVFTVTIIILVVCCALKTREVKKLTKIMYDLSRTKKKERIHRPEFNDWSSVTSSLRPSLPPRPVDHPSVSDTRSYMVENDENVIVDEEVYDNIMSLNKHRSKIDCINELNKIDMRKQGQDLNRNFTAALNKLNKQFVHDKKVDNASCRSSTLSIGEYIDSSSVKSHMYRKVQKHKF